MGPRPRKSWRRPLLISRMSSFPLQWGHETKSRGDVYGLLQYGIVQGFNGATRLNLVETTKNQSSVTYGIVLQWGHETKSRGDLLLVPATALA